MSSPKTILRKLGLYDIARLHGSKFSTSAGVWPRRKHGVDYFQYNDLLSVSHPSEALKRDIVGALTNPRMPVMSFYRRPYKWQLQSLRFLAQRGKIHMRGTLTPLFTSPPPHRHLLMRQRQQQQKQQKQQQSPKMKSQHRQCHASGSTKTPTRRMVK
ncbi:MAG: hypothetical protein WC763_06025 [Candidatus Paceibacterota bacterium]|jgi:hypothetical protein